MQELGQHWIVNLGASQVHMDTLLMAWASMIVLIFLALAITRNLNRLPNKLQTSAEMVIEFIKDITVGQMGKEGYKHINLIGSLFLFIVVANLIGQLPWRLYHLKQGELASPTNDINVTAALALIVSVYYFGAGISKYGLSYFKHYLKPFWFMAPFNLLEDFTRPLSLSLRLFANIFAGEVIVLIIISFVPLILPLPIMIFELFIAFIQAFIFAVLAASYVAYAVSEHN
ncbi:MAG: F0F1 ATP synthase subunit A [bacterium]